MLILNAVSSDLFRSENNTPKAPKPFVLKHFSQGRKRSEIGRKKVG